jgi:NifU-like protein involved in Fe-S cluster formation
MKLQFEVDESGTIIDAKFKTFGCGSAIASSSVATEWLKGRKVEDCLSIKVSPMPSSILVVLALPCLTDSADRTLILLRI